MEQLFKQRKEKLDILSAFRKKRNNSEKTIPENLFRKCSGCGESISQIDWVQNYFVCPKCGYHMRISAQERLRIVLDEKSFREADRRIRFKNILDFEDYREKHQEMQERTGLNEAVVTGVGTIDQMKVVIAVMDGRFLMGSMGSIVGEKITRAVELATKRKLPFIIFSASGGARMQEGIFSLMQMAKTSAAIKRFDQAGGLFISVMTNPTTGGVTASFASLGDIILAEPGALIGFAGPRVIEQTMKQSLPEGFQRAEFLLQHGFLDDIVQRKDLKKTLSLLLKLHGRGAS